MALPANVTYGTVAGRFLIATADTPDDTDRDPQGIAAADLKITFSPDLGRAVARDPTATPPTFFALADVSATIAADGTLLGPDGQPGVRLVASTNPVLEPTGWTWQVKMSGTGYPNIGFSFLLDGGQNLDLGTVLQVPSNPGATLGNWIQAVTDAQAARDAAIAAAASVPSAASLAATYVSMTKIQIGLDTDGVPYLLDAGNFAAALPVLVDTDGVPYLAA